MARRAAETLALAFTGIHVISPKIFGKMTEEGSFSIIDAYLRLAERGERIAAYRANGCYWRDLGRPEHLLQAAHDIESGTYSEVDAPVIKSAELRSDLRRSGTHIST